MTAEAGLKPGIQSTSAIPLRLRAVTKYFGGLAAVDNVDLDVRRGEILGLIGPNGAGKTTLINLVSGAERPTSGSIELEGTDVLRTPPHAIARLGLARTFQIVKPFPNLLVRENVAVGALFGRHGMRRPARAAFAAADEVLERVGLASQAGKLASELTLAGRKRLEIAKALAADPQVILLDEVMAGLNDREVDDAMALLQSMHASGMTLVVVEHVMKAIMGVSHRIVVMHQGRIIADGAPQDVVTESVVIEAYLGKRYAAARNHARNP